MGSRLEKYRFRFWLSTVIAMMFMSGAFACFNRPPTEIVSAFYGSTGPAGAVGWVFTGMASVFAGIALLEWEGEDDALREIIAFCTIVVGMLGSLAMVLLEYIKFAT